MNTAQSAAGAAVRMERPALAATGNPWPDDVMAHLYAHTLTASTQAAAACGELAEIFDARGEHASATLFRQLAIAEAERAAEAIRRIGHRPLPQGPAWQHYSWLYQDSPNHGARKLIARLITSSLALRIALEVGGRIRGQYERLSASAEHPEVRAHARELAAEKAHQLSLIADALVATETCADDGGDSELLFAMP